MANGSGSAALPVAKKIPPNETVAEYATRWFEVRQLRLRPKTAAVYRDILNSRIKPQFASIKVTELSRMVVERWVAWAERQRQKGGKPYTRDTLRSWWRVLSAMLKDLSDQYEIRDPSKVAPPKSAAPHVRELRTLTEAELDRFLRALRQYSPNRYCEILTVALSGCRAGEVYALCWDAVDLELGRFEIKRSISDGRLIETTKTDSPRTVPIHPALLPVLKEHKAEQEAKGYTKPWVFPTDAGKMRGTQTAAKVYLLASQAAGLSIKVGPQVLRRTVNTLIQRAPASNPATTRSIMGHSSEEMTLRYSHVSFEDKLAAIGSISVLKSEEE